MSACAYCGVRRAIHDDHVIPKAVLKRYKHLTIPAELREVVGACGPCNWLKSTRKLVPPSWADRLPALRELIPGDWRIWYGDVREPAFRSVHQ